MMESQVMVWECFWSSVSALVQVLDISGLFFFFPDLFETFLFFSPYGSLVVFFLFF